MAGDWPVTAISIALDTVGGMWRQHNAMDSD